jgi:RNA polymerase sigma-70 factor (ECF subfamily)
MTMAPVGKPLARSTDALSDNELVERARARDGTAFRTIMKAHNQRLYRLARGIVRNDAEAEDIVQEGYVRAFSHLDGFRGDSSLATWLSRIVINEALGRMRKKRRSVEVPESSRLQPEATIIQFPVNISNTDNLPDVYRTVFVARVIEGLSIDETSELLGVKPETVKTRLHRARHLVRKELDAQIGPVLLDAFPFAGRRCERLTVAVLGRLGLS